MDKEPMREAAEAQAVIAELKGRQGVRHKLAELNKQMADRLRFDERKRLAVLREPLLEQRLAHEKEREQLRRRKEQQQQLEWAVHLEEQRRRDESRRAEPEQRRQALAHLLEERLGSLATRGKRTEQPEREEAEAVVAGLEEAAMQTDCGSILPNEEPADEERSGEYSLDAVAEDIAAALGIEIVRDEPPEPFAITDAANLPEVAQNAPDAPARAALAGAEAWEDEMLLADAVAEDIVAALTIDEFDEAEPEQPSMAEEIPNESDEQPSMADEIPHEADEQPSMADEPAELPHTLLPLLFLAVIFVLGFCTFGLNFKTFYNELAIVDAQAAEEPLWSRAERLIDRWQADAAANLAWQEELVALDGLAARVFDKHFVRDTDYSYSIIKDNHDWLQFITYPAKPREIVRNIADYQELDVPILYVQPPTKFIEGYTEFPPTLRDQTAANVAQNLALLDKAGVPYLDLRAAAAADGLDKEQMFYRTDHHWRVETAFWAAGRTVSELEELYGLQLDPEGFFCDPANWRETTWRQNFLGSQGRRVGPYYGGLDDFTLLAPAFDTRFRLERKLHTGQLEVSQGGFEEVILDKGLLEAESVYTNRYGAYWGADYPTVLADNLDIDEGLTIMIIKDSYALPYGAFLATMADKLYMVDLRYFAIEGLAQYIREVRPDLLLIMYS